VGRRHHERLRADLDFKFKIPSFRVAICVPYDARRETYQESLMELTESRMRLFLQLERTISMEHDVLRLPTHYLASACVDGVVFISNVMRVVCSANI
jgi:hypothetical protein